MPTKVFQTYPTTQQDILSKNASTFLAEQSIMDHVMKMMADTEVPRPDEPTSPLYKVLVQRIRKKLKTSKINMDYLDIEVKARQMARWVELIAVKAATKSLSNIQARKLITPTNEDIPIEQLVSEDDEDRENIFIERLAKNSDTSNLHFGKTGQSFTLLRKGGKKIMVEGLKSDHKKKALITKELSDGELESWIIQMPDKELLKSTDAINSIKLPKNVHIKNIYNKKPEKNTERKPLNVDEWKAFADLKQMEVKQWKKRIDSLDNKILQDPQKVSNTQKQRSPQKPSSPQKQRSPQNTSSIQKSSFYDSNPDKFKHKLFGTIKMSRANTPTKLTSKTSKTNNNYSPLVTSEGNDIAFKIRTEHGAHYMHRADGISVGESNQKRLQVTVSSKTSSQVKPLKHRSRTMIRQPQIRHRDFTPSFHDRVIQQ